MTGSISEPNPPVSQNQEMEVENNDPIAPDLVILDFGGIEEDPQIPDNEILTVATTDPPENGENVQDAYIKMDNNWNKEGDEDTEPISLEPQVPENTNQYFEPQESRTKAEKKNREAHANMACLQPEPRMFTDVVIDGKMKVSALVDPGADFTMITEDLVKVLGYEIDSDCAIQIMGMGKVESGLGRVVLGVSICGSLMRPTVFQVMKEGSGTGTKIWLGRDFLTTNKMKVDYPTWKLKRWKRDGSLWELYVGQYNKGSHVIHGRIPVKVDETVKLEAGVSTKVGVSWEPEGECEKDCWYCKDASTKGLCFDPDTSNANINIHPGILENNKGEILISRSEDGKGDKIRKGTVIGWVSPIIEVERSYKVSFAINDEGNPKSSKWTPQDVMEKVKLGDHLNESQKKEVHQLIINNIEALSDGNTDIGRASITAH